MKGLIMIGYQGVGKSGIGGKQGCVDLESSSFYVDGARPEKWYEIYCRIAIGLAAQGYTVLTSSHKDVVEYFKAAELPETVGRVVVVCPRGTARDAWIRRLEIRYQKTKTEKDYRALINAKEKWDESIAYLYSCGLPVYQPQKTTYDLMYYVRKARMEYCQ